MSRTKKGSKPFGVEFWTARPFNRHGSPTGAYAKKRTHKAERAQGKRETALVRVV
jgi:hypothetical protein